MLKKFRADLHIHTCLSPCADLEMTPAAIVTVAAKRGIDMVAITDHNSAENIPAALKAAERSNVTVLAGMEITSAEEAHVLALFQDIDSIIKMQNVIYKNLPPTEDSLIGNSSKFGEQVIVNEHDEVLGFHENLLIVATLLSANSVVDEIHSLGGLAIASHIDKEVFSIISQLGFIPEDIGFDALEMSPLIAKDQAELSFQNYNNFTWISSSDAHYLQDLGRRTTSFFLDNPTVDEISLALKNIDGRKAEWK